ncbi:MAG: uracil-DNA glycosylase family protein [Actinomycetota bacterium]|nr:uracil-DNA glycosylase family protein [Actinomycetota bacterium]
MVKIGNTPAVGSGTPRANIIIVRSYPEVSEAAGANGSRGTQEQDKFLKKILNKTGLSLTGNTYITYLVKCTPEEAIRESGSPNPKPVKLHKKHVNKCIHFLTQEISIITPHIIVSLGLDVSNIILKKFFSIKKEYKDIKKIHMKIFENPSFKLVPFFDPRDVLLTGSISEKKYIRDFESLSEFLKIV